MTLDRRASFPLVNGMQPASGRAGEFRTFGGQLQQLGDDHVWRPYVPFEQQRESVRAMKEAAVRGRERWREEARQRLEAKAAQRRAEMEGRMVEQEQLAQEVPVTQTQETPAVGTATNGRRYSDEFKRSATERFRATRTQREKEVVAEDLGVSLSTLYTWSGRQLATSVPAPAPAPPPAPAAPAVDTDFATELDVLARLLALPADARDRVVAYVTSRRGP